MNIRDIARRARVSHSTVSRVINHVDTVDPKMAQRVQAVIEQVGYRPNYQARALARGRSHTVGLIVSELSGGNPFFSEIILYFERAAVAQGYEVLVSFADIETRPDHIAVCAARMQERQVDGIAALTFGMEEQLAAASLSVPVVYAGAAVHDVRTVHINYLTGFREAITHLAGLGHKRIGYLSGRLSWGSLRARYNSLRRAMRQSRLPLEPELLAECDHTWEGGAQGMASLLSLRKPPTAVLCCNDVAAVGAMKTLAARGMQAGRDIALIGMDDLPICQFAQPPLTSIQFSPRQIAALAFRALLEEIQHSPQKTRFEYQTHLILRESTCPPRR